MYGRPYPYNPYNIVQRPPPRPPHPPERPEYENGGDRYKKYEEINDNLNTPQIEESKIFFE